MNTPRILAERVNSLAFLVRAPIALVPNLYDQCIKKNLTANCAALKITRNKIGPTTEPSIAMLAVIPAVIGTNVNQNRASPIPPNGPIAATRTARIV